MERRPEISPGYIMQGPLDCGQDLGLDSKNDRKPGKGCSQAGLWCGQICIFGRTAWLQCQERIEGAQVGVRRPGRRLLHSLGER